MLNGQLSNNDQEPDRSEEAFSILKKSETHSGIRHGLGGTVGKVPQAKNANGKAPAVFVYEVYIL